MSGRRSAWPRMTTKRLQVAGRHAPAAARMRHLLGCRGRRRLVDNRRPCSGRCRRFAGRGRLRHTLPGGRHPVLLRYGSPRGRQSRHPPSQPAGRPDFGSLPRPQGTPSTDGSRSRRRSIPSGATCRAGRPLTGRRRQAVCRCRAAWAPAAATSRLTSDGGRVSASASDCERAKKAKAWHWRLFLVRDLETRVEVGSIASWRAAGNAALPLCPSPGSSCAYVLVAEVTLSLVVRTHCTT